jgi:hypothetical protein
MAMPFPAVVFLGYYFSVSVSEMQILGMRDLFNVVDEGGKEKKLNDS